MKLAELESLKRDVGHNTFYISLSDLMMLLCVFFVLILGMSKVDIGSFEKIRSGITGSTQGTLVELAQRLEKLARGKKGVSVNLADDGVRLDFDSAALFATGSAVLRPGALKDLEPLLNEIKDSKYAMDIEGHSDDRPFYRQDGEEVETNWSLSGRRASSVVHYLIGLGFKSNHLRIVGYASTRPKVKVRPLIRDEAALERARALNRRVTILVK